MAKWVDIGQQSDIGQGQMVAASAGKTTVLVANVGGQFCATQDACPHRGGPLHEGSLSGEVVTCPWHGSRFNVKTGAVVAGPAVDGLQTYQTRVENGMVQVELP